MTLDGSANLVLFFSIILLSSFIIPSNGMLQSLVLMPSRGSIETWPTIDVFINDSQVIGTNNLSLGIQLDWEWKAWLDSPIRRELAKNATFKLVRFFDFRPTTPRLMPCIQWNETSQTGAWNWTNVDDFVQAIFDVGAEPLVCLGSAHSNRTIEFIPAGMTVDPVTTLPYPDSYAMYCREWIEHFKMKGWPVRFYEIFNEPWAYLGSPFNVTKLEYFKIVWNYCAKAMRAENPSVQLSFDCVAMQKVLDYWLENDGENIDFLGFHKYDCWAMNGTGYFDDSELLMRAEKERFDTTWIYGVDDARRIWFNARGVILPVICSESNLNSAYEDGTDPRIQQMIGATWTALVLRKAILEGLSYYVYYSFRSSRSNMRQSGGIGFGMVDFETNRPWYPYYVHQMIGNNLAVGDKIVESECNSDDLRVLAWIHGGILSVLVVSKIDQPRTIHIHIGSEHKMRVVRADDTIPWENASLQTCTFSTTEHLISIGYTVVLLQTIQ